MRRIISCHFAGPHSGDRWPRMARVLEHSAHVHCPGWQLTLSHHAPPKRAFSQSENHVANTRKLERWCEAFSICDDGDEVLLIDADTFIVRSLEDVWAQPFDLAYTARPPAYPQPLNGGVVFVRVSPATRRFMELWRVGNVRMLTDRQLQHAWRRYQGINQRALGQLLEEGGHGCELRALPCLEWNCEDSAWPSFDPAVTRIVHVKSALREAVFARPNQPVKSHLRALAGVWLALEQQAAAAASDQ